MLSGVGAAAGAGSASGAGAAADAPAAPQCVCIVSERPYHRFFLQCLQLLHAARLAGGPVALKLARMLIGFSAAPPGAILPLRSLLAALHAQGVVRARDDNAFELP